MRTLIMVMLLLAVAGCVDHRGNESASADAAKLMHEVVQGCIDGADANGKHVYICTAVTGHRAVCPELAADTCYLLEPAGTAEGPR